MGEDARANLRRDPPFEGPKPIRINKLIAAYVKHQEETHGKSKVEDTYGYPQQGINEKGLFFGGAQTEIVLSVDRKPRFDGVVVDHILRHCKNVQEALRVIQAYDFPAPEGQLLFADPMGQSFIWEAGGAIIDGDGALSDHYKLLTVSTAQTDES